MNKMKDEEREFKRYIAESYKSQMTATKQREIEERQRHVEEEKHRLESSQRQLEDEGQRKFQQRVQMRKECEELLQRKQEQKNFDREMQHLTDVEQRRLMESRVQEELERENKYRKHFVDCERIMQERLKTHIETVSSPESQRSKQIQDWIRKNEAEYQAKLQSKEHELSEWRKMVLRYSDALVEREEHVRRSEGAAGAEGARERGRKEVVCATGPGELQNGFSYLI